jgi:hypothetical protein
MLSVDTRAEIVLMNLENTVPHALFRNHRNIVLDGVPVIAE